MQADEPVNPANVITRQDVVFLVAILVSFFALMFFMFVLLDFFVLWVLCSAGLVVVVLAWRNKKEQMVVANMAKSKNNEREG